MRRSAIKALKRIRDSELVPAAAILLLHRSIQMEHQKLAAHRALKAVEAGAISPELAKKILQNSKPARAELARLANAARFLLQSNIEKTDPSGTSCSPSRSELDR